MSGRVLCSAAETLRPGPVYLLGLNPGGDPSIHAETVADSLAELPFRKENAYLDESWRGRPNGESLLQRRVQWLLTQLGLAVRDVCASNLIFIRSIDATGCGYPQTAAQCWPIHDRILEIVKPKLIVTFGNSAISPYRFLHDFHRPAQVVSVRAGHGNWRCLGFELPNGLKIVGLPHLSRYAIDRQPHVIEWIKAYARL